MYQYELSKYYPTADELPCSDDTLVDDERSQRYLTPYERAKLDRDRATIESQRADRLAAQLRDLGIEPEVLYRLQIAQRNKLGKYGRSEEVKTLDI